MKNRDNTDLIFEYNPKWKQISAALILGILLLFWAVHPYLTDGLTSFRINNLLILSEDTGAVIRPLTILLSLLLIIQAGFKTYGNLVKPKVIYINSQRIKIPKRGFSGEYRYMHYEDISACDKRKSAGGELLEISYKGRKYVLSSSQLDAPRAIQDLDELIQRFMKIHRKAA